MDSMRTTVQATQDFLPAIINSLAANPWVLLIALSLFGLWLTVRSLLSHPVVVDAVAKRINDTETSDAVKAIFSTVAVIRKDQEKSTHEREEQKKEIERILNRLDDIDRFIQRLPAKSP